MLIRFNGCNDGWGEYVINGTKKKPRDHDRIKVLRGDITLGDKITNHPNYRQKEYSIILSFKGKADLKIMENVLSDFEKQFMHGFKKDEYHIDAVLHMDTDDYHIHIRVPKLNLYTGTQLQLYFDTKDRNRINLIRNLLDMQFNLENPQNNRKLIQKEHNYKNGRIDKKSKTYIDNYIREFHEAGLINSFEDIKLALNEVDINIINKGNDYSRDFYYITVESESEIIRLKGDIYGEQFWENSRENRSKQINSNSQYRGSFRYSKEEYKKQLLDLEIELRKREKEVSTRYEVSRARANSRINALKYNYQNNDISREKARIKERKETTILDENNNFFNNDDNTNDRLSNLQPNTAIKMDNPKRIQNKTKKWELYEYTKKRYFLLKRTTKLLSKNGGLNGRINGSITGENSEIRSERKSTYNISERTREFIYLKARESLQAREERRIKRERYRERIDSIREKCATAELQFQSNIGTIDEIIGKIRPRNVKKFQNNLKEIAEEEAISIEEYTRECLNFDEEAIIL